MLSLIIITAEVLSEFTCLGLVEIGVINDKALVEQMNIYFLYSAYETLSNSVTRRAYDSVDPSFDDAVPSDKVSSDDFITTFTPVFESNARYDDYPCSNKCISSTKAIQDSY